MKFLSPINVNTEYTLPFVDGTNGQVLTTDGNGAVYWGSVSAGSTNLNALTDVELTNPTSGQILRYAIPPGGTLPVWYNWTPTFLTAESDTLSTVTSRGASTSYAVTFNGDVSIGTAADLSFGSATRQMINLWSTGYGIGVQSSTTYFRSDSGFAWFRGGVHNNTANNPGAEGVLAMRIDSSSNLVVTGSTTAASFVKTGGTASQFLKADGSVDTNTYLTSFTETDTLATVTSRGATTTGNITVNGAAFATSFSATGLLITNADTSGSLQPDQGSPANKIYSFRWAGNEQGYIDTDAKITFAGFKTPTGTASQFLKANGTVDSNVYITSAALSGYATQTWVNSNFYNQGQIDDFFYGNEPILGYNKTNWDAAYNWGNHASAGYATTSYVTTAIANLVDSAPATLDTLNELAAALGDDPNFATTVTNSIATKVPQTRTLTINGTAFDLSANRSWTIDSADGYVSDVRLVESTLSFSGEGNAFSGSVDLSTLPFQPAGSYLTAEADTLASVTGRGASTTNAITVGGATINGTWQTVISTGGGWNKLSFVASNAWGDGTTYGVLGAGGGAEPGVMTYNQHATWVGSSNGAGIRMGRSGGVASGAWYQVATMDSDEFMIAKNGQWSNGGIKITSGGELQHGNSGNKYWHAGNDGSGSGLDADLLDGNHASAFATRQDGARYSTDFNSILSSGFFNAEGQPANAPDDYGQLIVAKGIDTGLQIFGGYNSNNLWFRGWGYGPEADGFYPWRKIWHDGNDGSGSGLDADLLDGQQGSYYQPASTAITTSNIASQSVSYATSSGNSVSTDQTNFAALFIEDAPVATKEYVTSQGYITGYTETDTLATVTARGASTSTFTSLLGGSKIVIQNGNDGGSGRGIFMWTSGDPNWGIYMATTANGVSLSGGNTASSFDGRNLHHIRFRVAVANWSGFIWENSAENALMSLTGDTGNLYTRGSIYPSNQTTHYVDSTRIQNWQAAYSWGNHADAPYWNIELTDDIGVAAATVRFSGSVRIDGDLEVIGTITETSSIRFKENITQLDPALDKVNQLEAVSYNKTGVDDREIGLIAEDVAELFPEVVTYNEEGQPQGIQYQRLSVILLKAVQELTERVNKLENK